MLKEATKATLVARVIAPQLKHYGEPIIEVPVNTRGEEVEWDRRECELRSSASSFVNLVYPGQAIEHLGRSDMLCVQGRYSKGDTSSLFFQAVHCAYANHHALGLRPEVLMYLVNSVVAETVRRHPDDYRNLFTKEADKKEIEVRHDGLRRGDPESPWNEAIALFDAALRNRVPSDIMEQMLPLFSTATEESNVASLVSFMDAASPYYDYTVSTRCGIPRVVLLGETEDYQRLLVASTELGERFGQHLGSYFEELLPTLKTIADTASGGEIDEDFWAQPYKVHSGSGGDTFSGWLSHFLWYVHRHDWQTKTNPLVEKSEIRWGIPSGSAPSHVTRVPFKWEYFDEEIPMDFIGGVLGIEEEHGALTPQLSYGVLNRAG